MYYVEEKCKRKSVPWCTEDFADLVGLEKPGEIGVGHFRHGQIVALLQFRLLAPCAVQCVQLVERGLGPNDETSDVAARRQFQEVDLADVHQVDSGNVAECLADTL